jgi:AraC-like DNA-binding protein
MGMKTLFGYLDSKVIAAGFLIPYYRDVENSGLYFHQLSEDNTKISGFNQFNKDEFKHDEFKPIDADPDKLPLAEIGGESFFVFKLKDKIDWGTYHQIENIIARYIINKELTSKTIIQSAAKIFRHDLYFLSVLTETGNLTDDTLINTNLPHNLRDVESDQINRTLQTLFHEKKPFLRSKYSIKELSEELDIPLNHLSAFINYYFRMNFDDFMNSYRITHCRIKIHNQVWRYKELETIARESGFSNRNTFTAAFKKVTGLNPSEYLRRIKEEAANPDQKKKPG